MKDKNPPAIRPTTFEELKQVNQYGAEYWSARDLQPLLGYTQWRRFEDAINRAKTSCRQSGNDPQHHFAGAGKMITLGKGGTREVSDYHLSRFACYLIAQNGKATRNNRPINVMQSTAKPTAHKCSDRSLEIIDCGLADYREVLARQHELCEQRRRNEIPNTVLILEHPPVITLGARRSANKLLVDREELARRGIDVVEIRRGGGTTAHNPGQLVFYPILHIQHLGLGISDYIRKLEEIGIDLLGQLGVKAERQKGFPGLWVENDPQSSIVNRQSRKIASIGVRVSKFVTHHGMAINICNDLSIFDLLVPCGLENVKMTSVLEETGKQQSMRRLKKNLADLLVAYFS